MTEIEVLKDILGVKKDTPMVMRVTKVMDEKVRLEAKGVQVVIEGEYSIGEELLVSGTFISKVPDPVILITN